MYVAFSIINYKIYFEIFTGSANLHETLKERDFPEIPKFKFILMTSCKNFTYPIVNAENMWKNEVFDPRKKTVVLVTGWMTDFTDVQDPTIYSISKAYMCRGDVNFIVGFKNLKFFIFEYK